jgi:SNF2 family DNA or RNA helicase
MLAGLHQVNEALYRGCGAITEASHVIHYGRRWNPAVETQVTDRAYRLGQQRRVHVYLPILEDKAGRVTRTFNQLLDELIRNRFAS